MQSAVVADGFTELPVKITDTLRLRCLPNLHRDPIDRLLIAQSIEIGARLLTRDGAILAYAGTHGFDPIKA